MAPEMESPHPIMFIFPNLIPSLIHTLPHPHRLFHAGENLGITTSSFLLYIIISHCLLFMPIDFDLECEVASGGLNTGAVLSISIAIFLVALSTGTLLATFITYCCMRRGKSSGKPQLSSSEGQKRYTDRKAESRPVVMLEMKENIAYCHVEH